MHELDHPLGAYTGHLKELHALNVSEYFEALVAQSGVDEQENIRLVAQVRDVESAIERSSSSRGSWIALGALAIIAAAAATAAAFYYAGNGYWWLVPAVAAFAFAVTKVRTMLGRLAGELRQLEAVRDELIKAALEQMQPLNALHEWGAAARLFQQTLPLVQLDPFAGAGRMNDLVQTYGLSPDFGGSRSALLAQTGAVAGNPLVFERTLRHWIGTCTYTGSMTISWSEVKHDHQGRYITVHRTQVLTAYVVKEAPAYVEGAALIYAHEAEPDLNFSRTPSNLSGLEESRLNDWRIERRVKSVERRARRELMSGSGQLTVMANRDFEALFQAADRDDESGFRYLFTPLAQQEMVKLLNDKSAGYGDDFSFTKQDELNIVQPAHLDATQFGADPGQFRHFELAESRRRFNEYQNEYFRSLYFSLAPVMAIPAYRDARSLPLPDGSQPERSASSWELEVIANHYGEAAFAHPDSITRNLLKTNSVQLSPSVQMVEVTAHGYLGVNRIDYVPRRGGDGNVHGVPVQWTEYFPVENRRSMLVGVVDRPRNNAPGESDGSSEREWLEALSRVGGVPQDCVSRGPVVSYLMPV